MNNFTKDCSKNLKVTIVLCALYSGVFAQNTCELHLTSGDRIECSTFKQVFTTQLLCYLCNGDTIQAELKKGSYYLSLQQLV